MLKCVLREVIDHSDIEDYSGPDVVYYFHDTSIDVMYMLPMNNNGNMYSFTQLTNESGFNLTFKEWCKAKDISMSE